MLTVSNSFIEEFTFGVRCRIEEMSLAYYLQWLGLSPYQAWRVARIEIDAACEMA